MSQPISVQDSAQVVCGGAARQVMLEDILVNHKQQNGGCNAASPTLCSRYLFYPKLSYMIDSGSTPRLSSILTTALLIGPGPHI